MLYKYVHGIGELIKTRLRRAVVRFSRQEEGIWKRVHTFVYFDKTSDPCDAHQAHFNHEENI